LCRFIPKGRFLVHSKNPPSGLPKKNVQGGHFVPVRIASLLLTPLVIPPRNTPFVRQSRSGLIEFANLLGTGSDKVAYYVSCGAALPLRGIQGGIERPPCRDLPTLVGSGGKAPARWVVVWRRDIARSIFLLQEEKVSTNPTSMHLPKFFIYIIRSHNAKLQAHKRKRR